MNIVRKVFVVAFSLSLVLLPSTAYAQSFDRNLYYGLQGDSGVTELQEFLTDQGLYSGPITGNFFSLTLKAVKQFQVREGITPAAGYFGPLTRARANVLLSSQVGQSEQQAISETGSPTPTPTTPKTTTDVFSSLQQQITLLLQQVALLQQQLSTQQQTQQTIQQQQSTLQQIQQNTTSTPSPAPTPTPTPTAQPSVIVPKPKITLSTSTYQLASYFISWEVADADYCEVPQLNTKSSVKDSVVVTPTSPTSYTISCTGKGGITSTSVYLPNRYTYLTENNISLNIQPIISSYNANNCARPDIGCLVDVFKLTANLPPGSYEGTIIYPPLDVSLISEFRDNYYLNQMRIKAFSEGRNSVCTPEEQAASGNALCNLYLQVANGVESPTPATRLTRFSFENLNGNGRIIVFNLQLNNSTLMRAGETWRFKVRVNNLKIYDWAFGRTLILSPNLESDWMQIVR